MQKGRRAVSKKPTIQDLQQQIAGLTLALQRERADAVNLRRRSEEEKLQAANFYKALIVRDLLPVVDNCERLLGHIPAVSKNDSWKQGAEQIVKQIHKVLADLGVERIKTVGEHFNPYLHDAVHMDKGDPSTSSGQVADEIISEELQPGYKLGDEIIRHAMVKVRKS